MSSFYTYSCVSCEWKPPVSNGHHRNKQWTVSRTGEAPVVETNIPRPAAFAHPACTYSKTAGMDHYSYYDYDYYYKSTGNANNGPTTSY